MKQFCAIIFFVFVLMWLTACGGGSSHSGSAEQGAGAVDYEEIDVYPAGFSEYFADRPSSAYDGNEQTCANVYHPTFDSYIKFIFPDKDLGNIKDQEFWALLHGNGRPVDVYLGNGEFMGTVSPPSRGWFRFSTNSANWTENIRFACDAGEQLMIYDLYKIVTYEERP